MSNSLDIQIFIVIRFMYTKIPMIAVIEIKKIEIRYYLLLWILVQVAKSNFCVYLHTVGYMHVYKSLSKVITLLLFKKN